MDACTAGYIREVGLQYENVYGRRKNYEDHSQWTESGKIETILNNLGSLVTEDCRSCHEVRRRIALGKEAFNKKSDLMRGSVSLHLKKRRLWWKYLFRVLCCMEAKRGLYKKKTFDDLRHLKYGFGGVWWKYHWLSTKQINRYCRWLSVETEREIMDTVRSLQRW